MHPQPHETTPCLVPILAFQVVSQCQRCAPLPVRGEHTRSSRGFCWSLDSSASFFVEVPVPLEVQGHLVFARQALQHTLMGDTD